MSCVVLAHFLLGLFLVSLGDEFLELNERLIPPLAPFHEVIEGNSLVHLSADVVCLGAAPVRVGAKRVHHVMDHLTVALAVALHAFSVKMCGLEGSDEGVPSAQSLGHHLVDVLQGHHLVRHQPPALTQDGVLDAVQNESWEFLGESDWSLSDLLLSGASSGGDVFGGVRGWYKFHQRNVVWGHTG